MEKLRACVNYQYRFVQLPFWLRPHRWYFVCVTFNSMRSQITTSLDGQLLATHSLVKTRVDCASKLTLNYDSLLGYTLTSFMGDLTQFNLWKRILTRNEIADLAACRKVMNGDIVEWKNKWETVNTAEYEVALKDLCDQSRPSRFKVFSPSCFMSGSHLCESLGGVVPTPRNKSDVKAMMQELKKTRRECRRPWVGVEDQNEEGVWRHHLTQHPVLHLPWAIDEPNGLRYENCAGLEVDGLVDDHCKAQRCVVHREEGVPV